jgi:two-component sensor histidine kinase
MHTERPFGAPLPATGAPETVRRAAEGVRPAVSDLLVGAVMQAPVFAVMVPVARRGRVDAVLSAPLDPGRLSALLASQGLGGEAFATLTDSRNVVVARSRDAAGYLGRPVPGWFPEATTGRESGVLKGRALTGHDVILAYRRLSSAPGWTVVVAEPLAAYEASWRRPQLALGIGSAATILAALLAAAWLGARILRPVRALARQAEAVVAARGIGVVPPPETAPAKVAEFEGLRRAMLRADAALRDRDARQALLVREVDHRAKNALAVVQAVVRLTPAEDPGAFQRAVQARVNALARTHTMLARGGWTATDLRALLEAELAPHRDAVVLDGPAVPVPATAAQPIALVAHELATNAVKHGALSQPGGRVAVSWRVADGALGLRWEESGGPEVAGPPARRGFGSRMIEANIRGQLGGTVSAAWEPAVAYEMSVPVGRAVADDRDDGASPEAGLQEAWRPAA